MEHKNIWDKYGMEEEKAIVELCEGYKEYLNHGKTERECITKTVAMAKEHGYRDLQEILQRARR